MAQNSTVVSDYEVFKNDKNALAFFFYRHPILDNASADGPFWFSINGGKITAGTEDHQAVFENVKPDLLETARRRGVIMLVEFEGEDPVRCTPCYLSEVF